jgi:hypothetical protein
LLSGWATSGNVPRPHMRRRRAFTTRSRGVRRHRRTRTRDLPSEVRELTATSATRVYDDSVSPSRSDTSPSSAAPTWLQTPWPSETTSNRERVLVACTGRVTLLVGGCDRQTAASSLVGSVPCYLAPACSAPTRNSWARATVPLNRPRQQSDHSHDLGRPHRLPLITLRSALEIQ